LRNLLGNITTPAFILETQQWQSNNSQSPTHLLDLEINEFESKVFGDIANILRTKGSAAAVEEEATETVGEVDKEVEEETQEQ
jgi:hypothetical protein